MNLIVEVCQVCAASVSMLTFDPKSNWKLHNRNDARRHHVRGADWPWNLHDPKNFSLTSASMRFKPSIFLSLLVILIFFLDLLEAYRGHQKYPRGPKREGAFRRRRKLGFSRSVQVFYNNDNHQRRQPGQLRKQQIDVRCRHLARQRFDSCGPSRYTGPSQGLKIRGEGGSL